MPKKGKKVQIGFYDCPECGSVEAEGATNWEMQQNHDLEAHGTVAASWLPGETTPVEYAAKQAEEAAYFEQREKVAEAVVEVTEVPPTVVRFSCERCDGFSAQTKSGLKSHVRAHDRADAKKVALEAERAADPSRASLSDLQVMIEGMVETAIETVEEAAAQEVQDKAYYDEVAGLQPDLISDALKSLNALSDAQKATPAIANRIQELDELLGQVTLRLTELQLDPRYSRGLSAVEAVEQRTFVEAQQREARRHNANLENDLYEGADAWLDEQVERFEELLYGKVWLKSKKFGSLPFIKDFYITVMNYLKSVGEKTTRENVIDVISEVLDESLWRYSFEKSRTFKGRVTPKKVLDSGEIVNGETLNLELDREFPTQSYVFILTDVVSKIYDRCHGKGQRITDTGGKEKWVHKPMEPVIEKLGFLGTGGDDERLYPLDLIRWEGKQNRVPVNTTTMQAALNAATLGRDDPRQEQVITG